MSEGKRLYVISMVFMGIAIGVYYVFVVRVKNQWLGLYPMSFSVWDIVWIACGICASLGILWVFLVFLPREQVSSPYVRFFADSFDVSHMAVFFLINAIAEELLFRGVLQYYVGVVLASVIFTFVHIAYYTKPWILIEVFIQGLVLGVLYEISESLWVCIICHTSFNCCVVWLIRKRYIS
ncbi:CPBP family intramembrane glutamic endopeptidase [uncultured Helicobacter sp.]|uniref:CPBP family intramembrane glutamic endopeptidase n=1 Tax=uncultured Helicobacter sp. TaxID=175537 RepID=UPI001C399910|nr:CPBP family intramembrane metalloprotease [Candidatus Helicobacter avicola]